MSIRFDFIIESQVGFGWPLGLLYSSSAYAKASSAGFVPVNEVHVLTI